MKRAHEPTFTFAIVEPELRGLIHLFRGAFTHPWTASYQIGFGPPLVKSSERLSRRLVGVFGGLDKLDHYLTVCFFDSEERSRLAAVHRRLLVRRHGPVEAEAIDRAAVDVLDLSLRLHTHEGAPAEVRADWDRRGERLAPDRAAPETLSGRFVLRLHDPRNLRMLEHRAVKPHVRSPDDVAVELRVHTDHLDYWRAFLREWRGPEGRVVEVVERPPRARSRRDGVAH